MPRGVVLTVIATALGACSGLDVPGAAALSLPSLQAAAADEADEAPGTYDPSDPTRVDARTGGGFKYTGYAPDGYLLEFRAKIAVQLNPKDLLTLDIGVGENKGVSGTANEFGLTDGRFRYFRMWDVDRSVIAGWQGWGTSVELQTPGTVPGTDGSGLIALGGMGAFGLGKGFAAYVNPIVSSVWTDNLGQHLGIAVRGDLFLTYKPGVLWEGAYLKVKPSVSYGVSQAIADKLAANVEVAVGGAFTNRSWWDVQARKFFERDLDLATEGRESGLADDWSVYLSFTYFF